MTDYASARPKDVRALIRAGQITAPTTGMCDGYAQGNLVVLPKELAWDFLLFCQRNPKSCPLLEVADAGSHLPRLRRGQRHRARYSEIPRLRRRRDDGRVYRRIAVF